MTVSEVITALCLPADTLVNQRVPKKLLLENGAPTGADKRQINEGIEELTWVAALKPGTIGVPEFRDGVREYLEIAVLSLTLRPEASPRKKAQREGEEAKKSPRESGSEMKKTMDMLRGRGL